MGFSQTIVRNTVATYVRYTVVILVQFVTFPYMLNTLGDTAYGIYGFFWAVACYLILLDMGMSSAVVKYVARCRIVEDWKSLNKTISTIFVIYLFFGIIAILLCAVIIVILPVFHNFRELTPDWLAHARLAFMMIGLNVFMLLTLSIFRSILVGAQRLDLVNLGEATIQVLYGVSIFVLVRKSQTPPQNLLIATSTFTVATLLTSISYIVMMLRAFPQARISLRLFDRSQLRELFSFSAAALMLRVAIMFIYGSDQVVLGIFAVFATVAIYQIAVRISDMLRTFVSTTSTIFEPIVSELHSAQRNEDLRNLFLLFTKMCFSIGLPIVMLGIIFGQPFIVAWTGKTNETIPWALAVLLVVALFDLTQISASRVLLMTEKHWYQTKVWVIGSLAFLTVSVIIANVVPAGQNDAKMMGLALNKFICLVVLFCIIMSYTFSHVATQWRAFFVKCVLPVVTAAVPAALVAIALRLFDYPLVYYMQDGERRVQRVRSLLNMTWQGCVVGAVYLAAWWFIALTSVERGKFKNVISAFLQKFRGASA